MMDVVSHLPKMACVALDVCRRKSRNVAGYEKSLAVICTRYILDKYESARFEHPTKKRDRQKHAVLNSGRHLDFIH